MEERKTITAADGARIVYWIARCDRPGAPLLVFLHGAASNHTRWSEILRISSLHRACDTMRPDLRGNAESMWRGRLDLDVWARDVVAILDAEAGHRAVLVGHSLGAQIALQVAWRWPERVQALILIDPVFPHTLRGGRRLLWRLDSLFRLLVLLIRLFNACGLGRRKFPARDLEELDRNTRRELERSGDPGHLARKYSSLRHILPYTPSANYLQQLLATVQPSVPPAQITLPILAMLSTGTSIASFHTLKREVERFPHAESVSIQADHWPLTENPDQVRLMLEQWLVSRGLLRLS